MGAPSQLLLYHNRFILVWFHFIYQPICFMCPKPKPSWQGFCMRRTWGWLCRPPLHKQPYRIPGKSDVDRTKADGHRAHLSYTSGPDLSSSRGSLPVLGLHGYVTPNLNCTGEGESISLVGQCVLFTIFFKETVAGQMEAEHELSSPRSHCSKTSIILTTNNNTFKIFHSVFYTWYQCLPLTFLIALQTDGK